MATCYQKTKLAGYNPNIFWRGSGTWNANMLTVTHVETTANVLENATKQWGLARGASVASLPIDMLLPLQHEVHILANVRS